MNNNTTVKRPVGGPGGRGFMGGPMHGAVEKPRDFKNTMKKLVGYCKSYLPVIIVALAAAAVATVLQILGPNKLKDLANEITKGLPAMIKGMPVVGSIDMTAVGNIAWLLVFYYSGSLLLNFIQSFIMATVTQKISKKMRTDISLKINRLPLSYFDRTELRRRAQPRHKRRRRHRPDAEPKRRDADHLRDHVRGRAGHDAVQQLGPVTDRNSRKRHWICPDDADHKNVAEIFYDPAA